jgi:hypothetical protein
MSSQDDNNTQILYGVSHLDGVTLVPIQFTADGGMKVDAITEIQFDPSISLTRSDNAKVIATATSITDGTTVMPWVVNASTGAVLVEQ